MAKEQSSRDQEDSAVVAKLRNAGIRVSSVFDLVNSEVTPEEAIPPLITSLDEVNDTWIKQGVVRALTTPAARGVANGPLIRQFELLPKGTNASAAADSLKWAIANALSILAVDSDIEQLVTILRDEHHGKAREMIALAVGASRAPNAVAALCASLSDPVIAGHALMALNRLGGRCDIAALTGLEEDSRGWVRREARRMRKRLAPS